MKVILAENLAIAHDPAGNQWHIGRRTTYLGELFDGKRGRQRLLNRKPQGIMVP